MRMNRLLLVVSLLAAAAAVSASPSRADKSLMTGGYLTFGLPMGDWGKTAGFGFGLDEANVLSNSEKALAFRSSLGLHYNFSRTAGVPQSNIGANDKLDVETRNWSLFYGIGPELSLGKGDVRPFVFGTVGFDTYWTKSELSGTVAGLPYSAKHGDSRIVFAWSGGFGFRRALGDGIMGELSAEYRSGSGHKFLVPDEITTSGSTVNASRDARTSDQILIRFGTLFGG